MTLRAGAATNFADSKILITGARGFIASSLAVALAHAGAEVVGASRSKPGTPLPGIADYRSADLSEAAQCRQLVADVKPAIVFHMASHVSGRQDLATVGKTLTGNLISTVNLLTALNETGSARAIVIAGSCEEPRLFRHDDPTTAPSSPYAAAKLSASAYAAFFRQTMGMPISHARIFMGYGPGQLDLVKLVPYVTLTLLRGGVPKLSSGGRVADFVFIDDIVDGLMHLGASPEIMTLDIGTGQLSSIADVAMGLRDIIRPGAELGFGGQADRINEPGRRADVETAEALTGWRPRFDLAKGLHKTVEWYRDRLPILGEVS